MTESYSPDLIAVDGGGTSCRFAVLHAQRRCEVQLGSANVTTDRAAAIDTLRRGLARLSEVAGLSSRDLENAHAYLGLAGVMSSDDAGAVAAALPIGRVVVADDRMSSVVGALGRSDGAVIAVGTGSFVARRQGGACRFVGGWGLSLGDEASGAWLGRALLSEVLRSVDGLTPASNLIAAMLKDFGNEPGKVASFARTASAGKFAEFAPRIVAAAGDGDAVARALMASGAGYLSDALDALGWRPGQRLCLLGGLGPHYVAFLDAAAVRSVVDPIGSALDGALQLAGEIDRDGGAA